MIFSAKVIIANSRRIIIDIIEAVLAPTSPFVANVEETSMLVTWNNPQPPTQATVSNIEETQMLITWQ